MTQCPHPHCRAVIIISQGSVWGGGGSLYPLPWVCLSLDRSCFTVLRSFIIGPETSQYKFFSLVLQDCLGYS